MEPTETVRIKYVSDDRVEARVTGGVVPRVGEKIRIDNHDDEMNMYRGEWFVVEDVWWKVVNAPERHPDVVEVRLTPPPEEETEHGGGDG